MVSICLEGGLACLTYQHGQSSKHVTGLFNNGCLFKSVNNGGERGDGYLPRYQASHQEDVTK